MRVNGHLISAADAVTAARLGAAGVRWLEAVNGGASPDARRLRDEWIGFANETASETGHLPKRVPGETPDPVRGLIVASSAPVDVATAAGVLGISPQMVRRLCSDGTLDADRPGRAWWINPDSLAEVARQRKEA